MERYPLIFIKDKLIYILTEVRGPCNGRCTLFSQMTPLACHTGRREAPQLGKCRLELQQIGYIYGKVGLTPLLVICRRNYNYHLPGAA